MRPQRLLLGLAVLALAPAAARADVRVDIRLPSGLPGDGVLVHTYDATGVLAGAASTVVDADGGYRITTAQLAGAVFPLRVTIDRRLDGCTGEELTPEAVVPADGAVVALELPLTSFCAEPGAGLLADRVRIGSGGTVSGFSGASTAALVFTPPSADGGTVAVETADGRVLDTVPVNPQAFQASFTLHAPAAAAAGDLFLRWTALGQPYRVRIGTIDVQPDLPRQAPLGAGPVDVLALVDVSSAGAEGDPGGAYRADTVRLLRALLRPGDRLGVVAAGASARVLRPLSAAPGTGRLAFGAAGVLDHDAALAAAADALVAGGQPARPKVVVLITGSDTAAVYRDTHLRLARTPAGHRWPVVVVPTGFAAGSSAVAARIAADTGGFLTASTSPRAAAPAVLEAWARLHAGRRSLATTVSGSRRTPSHSVVRGLPGRPLRILATWADAANAARVTIADPAGRPVPLRALGRGVVAIVPRARAGAYRVTLVPARAASEFAYVRAELTAAVG